MPAYFFDSSALVKFYDETGTDWVRSFTDSEANVIHVSRLAKVETISALTRRLRRNDITNAEFDEACDTFEEDFATQFRVVGVMEQIIDDAAGFAGRTATMHVMLT